MSSEDYERSRPNPVQEVEAVTPGISDKLRDMYARDVALLTIQSRLKTRVAELEAGRTPSPKNAPQVLRFFLNEFKLSVTNLRLEQINDSSDIILEEMHIQVEVEDFRSELID